MIQLNERPEPPKSLGADRVTTKIIEIRKIVQTGNRPVSLDFVKYWYPECREILWRHQNKKCCYCERIRELKRESDLEHFRPKGDVDEDNNHIGYWWLAYDFSNYLFSCKICNEDYKKTKFPLLDSSTRIYNEIGDLTTETPVLIDPYIEDPEIFIGYYWDDINGKHVKVVSMTTDIEKRGEMTAKIIGLNRASLMEERAQLLNSLHGIATSMHYALRKESGEQLIAEIHEQIKKETSSSKAFSGFRRSVFKKEGLSQYISED